MKQHHAVHYDAFPCIARLHLYDLNPHMSSLLKKSSSDLDEKTPLLKNNPTNDPLFKELAVEQQLKQHAIVFTACLSFVCSFLCLFWLKSHSSGGNNDHHHHTSIWISALLSCCVVSPLVALQQGKLVQMEACRQSTAIWEQEIEELSKENESLKRKVQESETSLAP
jgi:hypothetical protein